MKKQQVKSAISALVVGIVAPLAMAVPASAATATWAGRHPIGSYNGKAGTATNWVGSYAPLSGDSVVFGTSGINQIIEFDSAHTVPVEGTPSLDLASIIFSGAWSGISSKSYAISSDNIIKLSGNIESVMTGNAGDHSIIASVALQTDSTFKTSGSNTLSVGDGLIELSLGANDLTLDASGGTISIFGKLTGSGNIIKAGAGKVNILTTPGTGGFTGSITIPTGEVNAVGTLGNITLSGGTLKGTGTVGVVTMSSGTVAPGASPGVLNTGDLVFTGGSHAVELGGKAAGQFDQLNVTGTVKLGTETTLNLSLVNSFAPAVNDSFVVVNNDAEDKVEGNFKGLKDGEKVTLGSYTYQINYDGGTGNDVVILVSGTPSAPDTGVDSLIGNPIATLIATLLVAGVVAGHRIYSVKKSKN